MAIKFWAQVNQIELYIRRCIAAFRGTQVSTLLPLVSLLDFMKIPEQTNDFPAYKTNNKNSDSPETNGLCGRLDLFDPNDWSFGDQGAFQAV